MSEVKGIPNGEAILGSALQEALERCKYDGNSIYSRIGGVQGLSQLVKLDDREIKKARHGIGPKTCEVIKMTKKVIMEAVAKDAEQTLKAKGKWKKE